MKRLAALVAVLALTLTGCQTLKELGKVGFEVDPGSGKVSVSVLGVDLEVGGERLLETKEEKESK